jgi:hypothetical protein
MDPQGNIYRTDKARRNSSDKEAARASLREDEARLDGYLKARAEADAEKHAAYEKEEDR